MPSIDRSRPAATQSTGRECLEPLLPTLHPPPTTPDTLPMPSLVSSIALRVHGANSSIESGHMWGVAATIGITLLVVHGLSYIIVEYGVFGGSSVYPLFNTPKPPSDTELGMTDTAPTSKLNVYQFQLFMAFVMYGTVMLAGLGAEYLVWRMFLTSEWNAEIEHKWKVAQFVFPILVGTAMGLATQGNFLCLPFLAASMWKLGFPETILLIWSAMYEKDHSFVERMVDLIRGVGTVAHHSSATIYTTAILFHVLPSTPDVLVVMPPAIMQHWFVLLKYGNKNMYIIIVTILEVWFEWTMFSTLEHVHKLHWIGGILVLSMLVAHWCYFGAGLISLIFMREKGIIVTTNLNNVEKIQTMGSVRSLRTPGPVPTFSHAI